FNLEYGAEALNARPAQTASPDTAVKTEAPSEDRESEEGKEKKKLKKEDANLQADSSEEEKKKKKDKNHGKDKVDERVKAARVRAWGGITATVLSVVLTVRISIVVPRHSSIQPAVPVVPGVAQTLKKLASPSEIRKIAGGKYEASGAAAVRG